MATKSTKKNLKNISLSAETFTPAHQEAPPFLSWKWLFIAPLVLALATWVAYYPSLTYDFQFDDLFNIKKFFALRSQAFKAWAFGGPRWISYALNSFHYQLDQFAPFVYRRSNVIFHSITGILIFFVTYLCLAHFKKQATLAKRAFAIAFVTAFLFLLHPVQTQTVSYIIQGQLEGLALLAMMALALCYLVFQRTSSQLTKIISFVLLIFFAVLSCGTKEIAILSPVMLLLIDWFFVSQGNFTLFKKKALFFVGYTALIFLQYSRYLDFAFLKNSALGKATLANNVGNVITNLNQTINPFSFFISQFKVIVHYITIFLWPFSISVDYDWKMVTGFWAFDCIVPLLILLALGIGTLLLLKKNSTHIVAFCSLWFFIGLAPRTTFIPSTELLVDYKTYFSSFGILFLLALGLVFLFDRLVKKFLVKLSHKQLFATSAGASVLCLALLGYATYSRNLVWESSENFWFNILHNAPKKARGYNNYAVALAEKGRFEQAIPYFRKAIKLDRAYPDPWSNISVCYSSIGKREIAIDCLRQAIQINPTYPEFYNNLSSYVLQQGNTAEAKKLAAHAIVLRPHYGKAYFNWGQALYNEGNKEGALEKIKYSCLNADYDIADTFKVYAEISVELQKYEDALIGYSRIVDLQPHNKDAIFNVGNAYYFLGRYEDAKQVYEGLIQQDPTEYRSWLNLAEIHLKKNNYALALSCYEKAQPMASYHPDVVVRLAECKELMGKTARA